MTHLHAMNRVAGLIRYLHSQGFSVLALLLTVIVFALSSAYPEEFRQRLALGDDRGAVTRSSDVWHAQGSEWLSGRATEVTRILGENGIRHAAVYSRVKSQDSAFEKAARKGVDVSALNDLYGMRVVVDSETDVYRCLGLIDEHYEIVPGTMKNYIIAPKASGYQSVHVVARMDDRRVEFQLRTTAMHLSAEAEHEAYKNRMRSAA